MNAGYDTRQPILEWVYLLMQGDRILSVEPYVTMLDDNELDVNAAWRIAVGVVNEFGRREIAGVVAEFTPRVNSTVYYLSSPMDGHERLVGKTVDSRTMIFDRISKLAQNGRYNDLACLPRVTLREGIPQ
ncbi:MAG: hypothetical protein AMXMBFR16_11380 [Candidatus Uhrbacteria bacterium]